MFVPYHWGTFHHITARAHDAINRLIERLEAHHLRAAVRILEPGETLELTREETRVGSHPKRRAVDRAFGNTAAVSVERQEGTEPRPSP